MTRASAAATISRREAMPLAEQIRQIDDYARVNGRDGLNGRERLYLQQRIANLRQHIRYAEQIGGGRGQRYGSADRYDDGRDQRYGNGDRYDGGRAYGANDDRYARDARDDAEVRAICASASASQAISATCRPSIGTVIATAKNPIIATTAATFIRSMRGPI